MASAAMSQQLQSLVRQAESTRTLVGNAKASYQSAAADLKKWQQRLGEVKAIKSSLERSFDSDVSDVKKYQKKLHDELDSAVSGFSYESSLLSRIASDYEKSTEDDGYGSGMHGGLTSEIARCNEKINSISNEASAAKSKMTTYQSQFNSLRKQAYALAKEEGVSITIRAL